MNLWPFTRKEKQETAEQSYNGDSGRREKISHMLLIAKFNGLYEMKTAISPKLYDKIVPPLVKKKKEIGASYGYILARREISSGELHDKAKPISDLLSLLNNPLTSEKEVRQSAEPLELVVI
jgi:hypothetical protein